MAWRGWAVQWLPSSHQQSWLKLHLLWPYLLRHQKRWLNRSARPMRLADEPTWHTAGCWLVLGVMHDATHDATHGATLNAVHHAAHLAHAQVLADVGRVGVALAHVVIALVRRQVRVDEAQVRRAHAEGDGHAALVRAHAAHARRHLRRHARARRAAGCGEQGCRLRRGGLQAGAVEVAGCCRQGCRLRPSAPSPSRPR